MVERAEEIYQVLINAGITEEEIYQEIKEKETEFQGFLTKQAILYLIAKDHGVSVISKGNNDILNHIAEDLIDYNDFSIPIASVTENMSNIVIAGKINNIFPNRKFKRKDGTIGSVGSFEICDQSECIKIVLWDDGTKVMENSYFRKGEIVQVISGYSKKGINDNLEIHIGRNGKLILAPKNLILPKVVKSEKIETGLQSAFKKKKVDNKESWTIQNLLEKEGFIKFISGIVQKDIFKEITLKNGEKTFLLKLNLSDDSSSIRVNIWGVKAVELFKKIKDGDHVKLTNLVIKLNSYSNEKEFNTTKSSNIEVI
ncbi:MAG: hypothetical protein JSV62_02295 [Promethearchaeota archaeon]|nr:MAG: hypothetical protein JSV62_02295 [Candidatus Lokiarchaeota archaeon]